MRKWSKRVRKPTTLQEKVEKYQEIKEKSLKKLGIYEKMLINFPHCRRQPLLVSFSLFIINRYGGVMTTQYAENQERMR